MNMFKPTKATSVTSYLSAIPRERKDTVLFLHAFIQKAAPRLKSHFAYNMLGYGSFPYKSYKGEMMSWPVIALASQKNYISIYVCSVDNGKYIAEKHKKELGKVSVGKSCIRFKRIADLNLKAMKKVILMAAKKPGLVGVGASKSKKNKN
jgi:hypothetical protein